jgi:hypothetical protein
MWLEAAGSFGVKALKRNGSLREEEAAVYTLRPIVGKRKTG